MKICLLAQGYPYPGVPQFPFVEQLCNAMADMGQEITVIAPHSVFRPLLRKEPHIPFRHVVERKSASIVVYTPKVITVSNLPLLGDTINNFFRSRALQHIIKKHIGEVDVFYCHFWSEAIKAFPAIKGTGKPIIVASGEAQVTRKFDGTEEMTQLVERVKGVVCVSTKNLNESVDSGLTIKDKCRVFPNSIDENLFRKLDKEECRKRLGLDPNDFILCFVGSFSHRKGSRRVSDAITSLTGRKVKSIFIGKNAEGASVEPNCEGIVFKGLIEHDELPKYLSASDIFVLPTRREGCCNAIVEALACGLPIVSSDREFNYDILDDTCSIMVEPDDIQGIATAIVKLQDDEKLRSRLGQGALIKAKQLTIENRAQNIIDFIKEKTQ